MGDSATAQGVKLSITMRDGSSQSCLVRELPIRALEALSEAAGRPSRQLEIYCDQAEGWSDTVSNESAQRILEEGDRLNFTWLEKLRERRARETKLLLAHARQSGGLLSQTSTTSSPTVP